MPSTASTSFQALACPAAALPPTSHSLLSVAASIPARCQYMSIAPRQCPTAHHARHVHVHRSQQQAHGRGPRVARDACQVVGHADWGHACACKWCTGFSTAGAGAAARTCCIAGGMVRLHVHSACRHLTALLCMPARSGKFKPHRPRLHERSVYLLLPQVPHMDGGIQCSCQALYQVMRDAMLVHLLLHAHGSSMEQD